MKDNPLPRLDTDDELRRRILPFCRLKSGEIWVDPVNGHRVGCLDATQLADVRQLMAGQVAKLAVHDPPYNLIAFEERQLFEYVAWCKKWVNNSWQILAKDSAFYVWLGADQNNQFQPLPDFMLMMRGTEFEPRSFITMRNQRGMAPRKIGWRLGRSCYITLKESHSLRCSTLISQKYCVAIIKRLMGRKPKI